MEHTTYIVWCVQPKQVEVNLIRSSSTFLQLSFGHMIHKSILSKKIFSNLIWWRTVWLNRPETDTYFIFYFWLIDHLKNMFKVLVLSRTPNEWSSSDLNRKPSGGCLDPNRLTVWFDTRCFTSIFSSTVFWKITSSVDAFLKSEHWKKSEFPNRCSEV